MVIPKPLCNCSICEEAREKGVPFERTGTSTFIHDENILIDTPAEIAYQLNKSRITRIDHLLFTHLDPDHIEGFRVVEQITLDFRTWTAYPDKKIHLTIPETLHDLLESVRSVYGPILDFYEAQGFIVFNTFKENIRIGNIELTAIPVDRGDQISFVYSLKNDNKKIVYAPCDIKPFPIRRKEVYNADLLIIQPSDLPRYKRSAPVRLALRGLFPSKDVVIYTPEEVKEWESASTSFIAAALREGRILYERK